MDNFKVNCHLGPAAHVILATHKQALSLSLTAKLEGDKITQCKIPSLSPAMGTKSKVANNLISSPPWFPAAWGCTNYKAILVEMPVGLQHWSSCGIPKIVYFWSG